MASNWNPRDSYIIKRTDSQYSPSRSSSTRVSQLGLHPTLKTTLKEKCGEMYNMFDEDSMESAQPREVDAIEPSLYEHIQYHCRDMIYVSHQMYQEIFEKNDNKYVSEGIFVNQAHMLILLSLPVINSLLAIIATVRFNNQTLSIGATLVFFFIACVPGAYAYNFLSNLINYVIFKHDLRTNDDLKLTEWLWKVRYESQEDKSLHETLKMFRIRKLKTQEELHDDKFVKYENVMLDHFTGNYNLAKTEQAKALKTEAMRLGKVLGFSTIWYTLIIVGSDLTYYINILNPVVLFLCFCGCMCLDGLIMFITYDMIGERYYDNSKPYYDGRKRFTAAMKIFSITLLIFGYLAVYSNGFYYGEAGFMNGIVMFNNDIRYLSISCDVYERFPEDDDATQKRLDEFDYLAYLIYDFRNRSTGDNEVVLAFRGTRAWNDVVVDGWTLPMNLPSEKEIGVHPGFYMYAMNTYDEIIQDLRQVGCLSPMNDVLCNLTLTGHSLGGSVSVVMGYIMLAKGIIPTKIVSFAAPAPFAFKNKATSTKEHSKSRIIKKMSRFTRNYRISSDAIAWGLGDRTNTIKTLRRMYSEKMRYLAALGISPDMLWDYIDHWDAYKQFNIVRIQSTWPDEMYDFEHHGILDNVNKVSSV